MKFQNSYVCDQIYPYISMYCKQKKLTEQLQIIKGFALKRALEVLGNAGWLERHGAVCLVLKRLPGLGPKRVYVLQLPDDEKQK